MNLFLRNINKKESEEFNNTKLENLSLKKQLSLIQENSIDILGIIDLDSVLELILNKLVNNLGYAFSTILLLNKEQKVLTMEKVSVPKILNDLLKKALGIDLLDIKLYTDKIEFRDNYLIKSVLNKNIVESKNMFDFTKPLINQTENTLIQKVIGLKNLISIPLIINNNILGTLAVAVKSEMIYENDKKVLITFANQIAAAIYNSRLFDQVQQQVNLLSLKNQDLQSIFNLTSQITKTLNPNEVAQNSVNSLPQDGNLIGAILSVINKEEDQLIVKAVTENELSHEVKKIIGKFSDYPLNINNVDTFNNPVLKSFKNESVEFSDNLLEILSPMVPKVFITFIDKILNIKSVMIFPVSSRGKVIGTITYFLRNKKIGQIEENEKQLLSTYTNQIGIALENANLYSNSQEIQSNLEKALNELQNRRKFEQDMLDVMGHELRTPMSILRNALSFLDMDMRKKGEISIDHQKKYIYMGLDAARRETSLIETLLSATKADSRGFQLLLQEVDFLKVVDNSLLALNREASKKFIDLVYKKPEGNYNIYCDITRVQEIVDNFLSNAIKYTEKGLIEITLNKQDEFIWLNIKDSGIGIAEQDLKKLGQKFFRAQQYTNDEIEVNIVRPGGTGLGLYVSFSLINIMDGKLKIESKINEGSTFCFAMPIYTNQANLQVQRKPDSYLNPSVNK